MALPRGIQQADPGPRGFGPIRHLGYVISPGRLQITDSLRARLRIPCYVHEPLRTTTSSSDSSDIGKT